MIIVKLMGGMGNQMFQYATARALAEHLNTEVKMDLSFLLDRTPMENFTYRDYELNVFKIKESFVTPEEINDLKQKPGFFSRIFNKKSALQDFKEKSFRYDSTIWNCNTNTYLEGFWQSYKYFENIRSILLNEFSLKDSLSQKSLDILSVIQTVNSVSIHVRRTDYVSNAHINNYHGACGLDYYNTAVDLISRKINNPHFFVFSDDPEWVKQNLKFDFPTVYVNHNTGKNSFEDMLLMSSCKHNVVANSSFSWWGAWLNVNTEEVVIAPKQWFNEPSIDTTDLCPDTWLRI